jgi:hypothetical protein
VKEHSSSRLEATVHAVIRPAVSVALKHGTSFISVQIEGEMKVLIIDTGSKISILQLGVSKSVMRHTDMRPYGDTGETLHVKGRQAVSFVLGGKEFNYEFSVCSLPTKGEGNLGMDFLKGSGAIVDLECNKMSPADIGKVPRAKCKTSIKALHSRFLWRGKRDTALNPPDGKLGMRTSRSQPTIPTREH